MTSASESPAHGTEAEQLREALRSSRTIGMAVGIVMERFKVREEPAFDLLVRVSKSTNRKLRDVAADLVFTGALDVRPDEA